MLERFKVNNQNFHEANNHLIDHIGKIKADNKVISGDISELNNQIK